MCSPEYRIYHWLAWGIFGGLAIFGTSAAFYLVMRWWNWWLP